ncbi:hypothetical protein XNC1_1094 [Xenorhabdus nematophila ATCC 19061]|uniref:Uncharacterized protein n=1 Tax=Xenorhabdus nematophila (strain ATCC 19061 / DSM 3370 / CCUG 14189 / LMG 1036 / NCIMB 9965 / AN6) TaxID=406817 RepID=D3V8W7_XENNA|nr:hypothetical protein XNC1_1094 [Xenorhabdus nematophila ATCC 19061]
MTNTFCGPSGRIIAALRKNPWIKVNNIQIFLIIIQLITILMHIKQYRILVKMNYSYLSLGEMMMTLRKLETKLV